MTKPRLLFVDDEPAVLEGLENRMRVQRRRWSMRFVEGADAALRELSAQPFDVLVTDVRLSDDDGLAFVEEVRARFPATLRFVLSGGLVQQDDFLRLALAAHHVLTKPCGPQQLEEAIERTDMLRTWVDEAALRGLVNRVRSLPVVPETYAALQVLLQDPECDLTRVSELISREVATSARLLQLVNSAVFARRHPAKTVNEAVNALGLSTLQSLVLSMSVFEANPLRDPRRAKALSRLQAFSRSTAEIAAQLAEPPLRATAYAAGMLHDIGRLVMLDLDGYAELVEEPDIGALLEAERRDYETGHPEVGAYLLGLWGLPCDMVRAAALHHRPLEDVEDPIAALVAVGARLAHEGPSAGRALKREHLEPLGLWRGVQAYLDTSRERESA